MPNKQFNFFEQDNRSVDRVFRYPGSKSTAAKHFANILPPGTKEVVSPFFGGGSFELYLTGRNIRVLGSDLFEPLVNLWKHILTDNKNLSRRAQEILLSDTREELKELQKEDYFKITNNLDRAAYLWLFYCLSWNGIPFAGLRNYVIIGRDAYLKGYEHDRMTFFDRLDVFRNSLITVDLLDYKDQLNRYPDTFTYLDPPYPVRGNLYGDSHKFHTDFNHEELRDILRNRNSLWMLSYNNHELILDLYSDDDFIIKHQWWNQGTNTHKSAKEVVIFPKRYGDTVKLI